MFWGKSHFQKQKKAPARMLVTVVRSGEAPPDGPFFKIRELANSKLFFVKINEKSMSFIYFALFPLRIGGIGRKAFSI